MSDLQRIVATGDPLTEIDRQVAGRAWGGDPRGMQLRWRVPDQLALRTLAAILRAMANRLEVASEPRRYSEKEALAMARDARDEAQRRLQTVSRPRKKP